MPITVEEKFGRMLADDSAERTYLVRGTTSDDTARSELLAASPFYVDGLKRDDAEVEEIGDQLWLGVVRYAAVDSVEPEVGESSFAFETRGGTQHITQSLSTVASYADSGVTAPDFGGAIGVTASGVEGTDITVPVYTFSETHYFDSVSTSYKGTLFSLTGRTNSASFKGLAAGECLFLGAAGTKRGDQPWEISFAFAGSPNVSGLSVGTITGIAKKGWEYLWVRYTEAEDTAAKMLIQKPIAAYVERVYREGNFSLLGIGT
ncbi:MAG: hypothetical protein WD534_12545 [Phycisphaeraceae bacterium]